MRLVALVVAALLAVPVTGNAFPSSAAGTPATQKSEQAKPRPAPKPAASPAKKKPTSKADSANVGSAARVALLKKRLQEQERGKKGSPAASASKVAPRAKAKGRS